MCVCVCVHLSPRLFLNKLQPMYSNGVYDSVPGCRTDDGLIQHMSPKHRTLAGISVLLTKESPQTAFSIQLFWCFMLVHVWAWSWWWVEWDSMYTQLQHIHTDATITLCYSGYTDILGYFETFWPKCVCVSKLISIDHFNIASLDKIPIQTRTGFTKVQFSS